MQPLYGPDVNFVSGCNYDTYKYYIDFASSFHIPYIVMDAGWAETVLNPNKPNSQMRLPELIQYGKDKNVGIILWLSWVAVEQNFDLFKTYEEWGIKGIKIDFMDRSDQWMVNFYERVAKEAAKHHLLVDFHGSFTPAGLEYKYPNVVSYEGVKGLEHMRGCYPDNSIYLPFMRNAVGPMDYTPGPMISMQPELYSAQRPNSAGVGTRAFQLATFILFESGLQMLADNPVNYRKNENCTRFISQVPVTWDQTKSLKAKVGEYVIVAKRKGNKWFIGGITNNAEMERKFKIPLDFLNEGRSYQMSSFEDGINSNRQATDYRHKLSTVTKSSSITITMKKKWWFCSYYRIIINVNLIMKTCWNFLMIFFIGMLGEACTTHHIDVTDEQMNLFVSDLMGHMTLREKIGQLNLPSGGDITTGTVKNGKLSEMIRKQEIGGFFNVKGIDKIYELQRLAVEESRLKIPLLVGADVIHGYETIFPIPLALSCSWDTLAVEKNGSHICYRSKCRWYKLDIQSNGRYLS